VTQLKIADDVTVSSQTNVEEVDYRFFIADLDSCKVLDLLKDSLIDSIMLNVPVDIDSDLEDAGPGAFEALSNSSSKVRRDSNEGDLLGGNNMLANFLNERAIPAGFSTFQEAVGLQQVTDVPGTGEFLAGSPYHLDWPTAPGANCSLSQDPANTCTPLSTSRFVNL
jgi:hypothetical protein